MIQAYRLIKEILEKVERNEKFKIFRHLLLSILVCLLDLILYNSIALLGTKSSLISIANISNTQLIIILIIFISFARLSLLYSSVITSASVARSIHLSLIFSYIKLPYRDFKTQERAFYLNKLSKHIELAIMALFSALQLFTNALTILISGIYILITADFKTIFLIVTVSILFWMISIYAKTKLKKVSKTYKNGLNSLMINNLNIISSFREIFFMQNHEEQVMDMDKLVKKTYLSGNSIAFYSSFSRYFLEPIVLITAFLFILNDKTIDITFIQPAIILSLLRITSVLQTFFSSWANLIAYKGFVTSISNDIKFIFEKDRIYNSIRNDKNKFIENDSEAIISIENLYYKYEKSEEYLLNNLNVNFNSGINVLIGENGCGKSTLLDIVSGLIAPQRGNVLIDNIPIWGKSSNSKRNVQRRKDLYRSMAYLPQEAYIYNESILKNITRKNNIEDCDLELLKELISILGLKKVVGKNLELINKLCGESGNKLSGGQKQRVALARSLYKKPKYLFLDESLSAIDETSRIKILEKLNNLEFVRFTILISHYYVEDNLNIKKYLLRPEGIELL